MDGGERGATRNSGVLSLIAMLVALVMSAAATAHGGGGALGFRSTVTRVTPRLGAVCTVLDFDDRLQLRNETNRPLVILGYEGEPYLAFRDGNVYRNTHSPATYLNDDRLGAGDSSEGGHAKAVPEWVGGRPSSSSTGTTTVSTG